jgi:putative membrane protein
MSHHIARTARILRRPPFDRAVVAAGLAGTLAAAALAIPAVVLAHSAVAVPAPTFPGVLLDWRFDPTVVIPVIVAGGVYWWAHRRVSAAHPASRPPAYRLWLWFAGLAAIVLALMSPIEAYDDILLSDHMVQHMLLEFAAAPLLLLGGPITLALRVLPPRPRRGLAGFLHSAPVRWISFPILAWILFAAVNWGWHFSSLYNLALENDTVHYIEHACFLVAALLFWWPVIGVDPSPWRLPHPVRILYLFLALPQNSFLGVAFLTSGHVLYEHYATIVRTWGPAPLDDQYLAGTLMWVMGDMVFLGAIIGIVWAWMRWEDRRTVRLDARLDAERAAAETEEAIEAASRDRALPDQPPETLAGDPVSRR